MGLSNSKYNYKNLDEKNSKQLFEEYFENFYYTDEYTRYVVFNLNIDNVIT
jgi:hypothetical protein